MRKAIPIFLAIFQVSQKKINVKKVGWGPQEIKQLKENYEFLFSVDLLKAIQDNGVLYEVEAGEVLIDLEDVIQHMPLLMDGAIKVLREDDDGDELLLYFLEKGDTCAMTMSCCMGSSKSKIRAVAERKSLLVMIPVENMSLWIQQYDDWRAFVFESYSNRMSELLSSIDSLAFLNMHDRVFKYLRERVMVHKDSELNVTHQEIANDLHTSRVVISRILKSLEKEGRISLHRNRLEVLEW